MVIDHDGLGGNLVLAEIFGHAGGFIIAARFFSAADEDDREVALVIKYNGAVEACLEGGAGRAIGTHGGAGDDADVGPVAGIGQSIIDQPSGGASADEKDEEGELKE